MRKEKFPQWATFSWINHQIPAESINISKKEWVVMLVFPHHVFSVFNRFWLLSAFFLLTQLRTFLNYCTWKIHFNKVLFLCLFQQFWHERARIITSSWPEILFVPFGTLSVHCLLPLQLLPWIVCVWYKQFEAEHRPLTNAISNVQTRWGVVSQLMTLRTWICSLLCPSF